MIYGGKRAPVTVALDPRLIVREMQRGGWRSHIYEVQADGGRERALMREIQLHPVSDKPLHVDFHRVAAGEPVRVAIGVHFTGENVCPGIKRGGTLTVDHHSVEVTVDPDRIPEHLLADISTLEVGDVVRWSDLKGAEAVTLVGHETDMVIATVVAPTVEPEPVEPAEAVAAPAETAPTED